MTSFNQSNKEAWLVNAAGPVWQVRDIVTALAEHLGQESIFEGSGSESDQALLADDSKARQAFGEYRDSCPQMIQAAAQWVGSGGYYWNKPTLFGRVRHNY